MDCKDIDTLFGEIRRKVVKGSKPTRAGRLRSCLRVLDPQQSSDVGKSALDEATYAGDTMNLSDAIARFRQIDEANISAPAVSRKGPDGQQTSSKSKFDHYKGADKTYDGKSASVPADADAKKAGVNTSQGVTGPGYDASGREKVDVRHEDRRSRPDASDDFGNLDPKGDLAFAEQMLGDKLGFFPSMAELLREANLAAPSVGRKTPDGKAQISSKSRFGEPYKGAKKTYDGSAASIPSDSEPGGPGASGREEVDTRHE